MRLIRASETNHWQYLRSQPDGGTLGTTRQVARWGTARGRAGWARGVRWMGQIRVGVTWAGVGPDSSRCQMGGRSGPDGSSS